MAGDSFKLAIFRADASVSIGGGHIMRCLTLADTLSGAGWSCVFVVRPGTLETVSALERSQHECRLLDGSEAAEPEKMAKWWAGGAELLVVDHYGRGKRFESACRRWARRIMVIDDLADRAHDCDLLLDQTLGRSESDYASHVPESCRMLLGPKYALLRPQFASAREAALKRRAEGGPVRRVLVSLGSTDPDNVTSVVLQGIAKGEVDVSVDVVMGGGAPHSQAVRELVQKLPLNVTVHEGVSDMASMMADADLAIGAAGTTTWERCCLGLTSLAVVTAGNQFKVAAALEAAGAAKLLGRSGDVTVDGIAAALEEITADGAARGTMSECAARVCDGLGGTRSLVALSPLVAKDGKVISLRPATMADTELMLEWQRDPQTRRFTVNPRSPEPEEHYQWMMARLSDLNCVFNVVLHGDDPAGVLRFDRNTDERGVCYVVSIFVAPDRYRLGIGLAALKLGRMMLTDAEIRAVVLPGNAASEILFEKAGYVRGEDGVFVSLPSCVKITS